MLTWFGIINKYFFVRTEADQLKPNRIKTLSPPPPDNWANFNILIRNHISFSDIREMETPS